MFESANLDHRISKTDYDAREGTLRTELLNAQYDLFQRKDRAVLILIAGVDGAGKGEPSQGFQNLRPCHLPSPFRRRHPRRGGLKD